MDYSTNHFLKLFTTLIQCQYIYSLTGTRSWSKSVSTSIRIVVINNRSRICSCRSFVDFIDIVGINITEYVVIFVIFRAPIVQIFEEKLTDSRIGQRGTGLFRCNVSVRSANYHKNTNQFNEMHFSLAIIPNIFSLQCSIKNWTKNLFELKKARDIKEIFLCSWACIVCLPFTK